MFRQIFCWVSVSRYWLFKREDIPEAGGGLFKDGQWILGGLLQHWNGNIQNEIMGSANVSPTLVDRRTCPDTYLDVTGCYLSLRTQHVATLPWLHRLIQEPLILLSFLPLQLIEISNSPIHFLEFLWSSSTHFATFRRIRCIRSFMYRLSAGSCWRVQAKFRRQLRGSRV